MSDYDICIMIPFYDKVFSKVLEGGIWYNLILIPVTVPSQDQAVKIAQESGAIFLSNLNFLIIKNHS